jgi:hypothetical protein
MNTTKLRLEFLRILGNYGVTEDFRLVAELIQAVVDVEAANPRASTTFALEKALSGMAERDMDKRERIVKEINILLAVNPLSSIHGETFVDHAYLRDEKGEDVKTFAKWWIINNPDRKYWSFEKMLMMWPQAFQKKEAPEPQEDKWIPFITRSGD